MQFTYASISENGTVNGVKGDQTKKEVKTSNAYNFGQTHFTRFKNKKKRKAISSIALRLAKNDNIGYSQNNRSSLFEECRRINWDKSRLKEIKKCNCDCSSFVSCVINLAYGKEKLPSYTTTYNISKDFIHSKMPIATHKQKRIVNKKLIKGDIVYKKGHVAIVSESEE